LYYPRSFPKFIVLGFVLVCSPLVYALVELAMNLDLLAKQSEQAVVQAAHVGQASRQVREQTSSLERVVRQYLILDDPGLLDDYARVRQEFLQTTRQLAAAAQDEATVSDINKLITRESKLYAKLATPGRNAETTQDLADGYAGLAEETQKVLNASLRVTEHAVEKLRQTAREGRENWTLLAAATCGIALALALIFIYLVARPIRQIDDAIRQIGRADFDHPIVVNGPRDLQYLGQRLEWLRKRLHELEAQQNKFMRHVSHELKTPLTAVREGAELLRDRVGGELSGEQQEIVRIIRENTLYLQKLIEDLLKYQQTRADNPHTIGPVPMVDVIRRVINEQKLAAYARGVTIKAEFEPVTISGDSEKLRVIVDNLMSNAIKYSPKGGVVMIRLRQHNGAAELQVIDQGPGVLAEEQERIFESFYQGQVPPDGKIKGTGLGLAITREYVLSHGGHIGVAAPAESGHPGACFHVRLPMETMQA
jgi:two-component system sensor histidine kinase GlrK